MRIPSRESIMEDWLAEHSFLESVFLKVPSRQPSSTVWVHTLEFRSDRCLDEMRFGVNVTNILKAAFTCKDPNSAKRLWWLKLSCDSRFQRAFTACSCVFEVLTLVGSNQGNYFENSTACNKRKVKTVSQRSSICHFCNFGICTCKSCAYDVSVRWCLTQSILWQFNSPERLMLGLDHTWQMYYIFITIFYRMF